VSSHKPIPELTRNDLKRFWSKVDKGAPDDCWLWTSFVHREYGRFWLQGSSYRTNRVSYAITYRDLGDFVVCHSCDNPLCVNPSHLWIGTMKDDCNDRDKKGRHGSAKLTESQV